MEDGGSGTFPGHNGVPARLHTRLERARESLDSYLANRNITRPYRLD